MKNILFGHAILDIYPDTGWILPGGGSLNMAYHWQQLGVPFTLLTRIGEAYSGVFTDFFERHGIRYLPETIVGTGQSGSIDIAIQADGQPAMSNFVEGVWADFRLLPSEERLVTTADWVHAILVEGVIREVERLGQIGKLAKPAVSADFLDFRHYTVARFADTMRWVDVGFIGWQGGLDDERIAGIFQVTNQLQKLVILTLGERGILVMDGRENSQTQAVQLYPVSAIPVQGTTVGCGDAFAVYFLSDFMTAGDIAQAIAKGKIGGQAATRWARPLPDHAY